MNLKKKDGSVISGIMVLIFMFAFAIMAIFLIAKYRVFIEGQILHNELVSSNLATLGSKDLDLDLMSQYPNVVQLKDPNLTFESFQKYLKYNVGLDDSLMPIKNKFIRGKVIIKEFQIYNVNSNTGDVTEYDLNPTTLSFTQIEHSGEKGNLKTPNGNVVNSTTIHSTINVTLDTVFGHKQSTDITDDNSILKK